MRENLVILKVLCEPFLNLLAKYSELAKIKHVDSKKNNFSPKASIPVALGMHLHPPLIGGQNGRHLREFLIPSNRNWRRDWRRGWGGGLGERLAKPCKTELCKIELSKTELNKTNLCKTERCKTELCKTELPLQ